MNTVTDFHTHAFPEKIAPQALEQIKEMANLDDTEVFSNGTLKALLESMDRAGVHRSVICSIATTPDQNEAILRWSDEIRSERIVPFPSIHPETDDVEGWMQRIKEKGFKGMKLHPYYQDFQLDDPDVSQIFECAENHELILVLHSGLDFAFSREDERSNPKRVLEIHKKFPHLQLVAAHMGGWEQWDVVLDVLAGTDVYLETSFSIGFGPDELMVEIIKKHGPERILFGTDSPWRDQEQSLQELGELIADEDIFHQVTCENAARLLRQT